MSKMEAGPVSGPVTGHRATRKVRTLVARFPELGQIRHVEANLPSPKAIGTAVAAIVTFCTMVVVGNGELSDVPPLALVWSVLAALILWWTGSEKVVICERGLLIGSFAPFLVPRVVPLRELDAMSVTACRRAYRIDAMLVHSATVFPGRTAVWAWNGVVFVAQAGAWAHRQQADDARIFDPTVPHPVGVWWFGTWREPDRLVHALEAALTAYGAPGAPGSADRALPKATISGRPEDAATQLPRLLAAASRPDTVEAA